MSLADGLPRRLLVAFLASMVAVVGLGFAVEVFEDRAARAAPRRGLVGPHAQVAAFELRLPKFRSVLGHELEPLVGTLLIAANSADLPSDVAPVTQVLADGSLALRRPVPLALAPRSSGRLSRDGHGAGLVLPGPDLSGLTAAARGTLCGLLSRWSAARPFPRHRLQSAGYPLHPRDLDRLLRWLP